MTARLTALGKSSGGTSVGIRDCRAGISKAVAAEEVLDDHSHKVVGMYSSARKAFDAGEGYALHWFKHGTRMEQCACDEIAT